jgi:hypothetical protein
LQRDAGARQVSRQLAGGASAGAASGAAGSGALPQPDKIKAMVEAANTDPLLMFILDSSVGVPIAACLQIGIDAIRQKPPAGKGPAGGHSVWRIFSLCIDTTAQRARDTARAGR